MKNKDKITISLDKDVIEKLEKISDEKCINKSRFINKIIKNYLENYDFNKNN